MSERVFIKNYTSETAAHITIARIEQRLIQCGVSGITKEYSPTGKISAIVFHIAVGGNRNSVRLPADESAVQQWLHAQWLKESPKSKKKLEDFAEQAERTAWKIMQEWTEIQLTMVQLQKKDFREVFLAYLWNGEQTFFQQIAQGGFKQLPEKSS